MDTELKARLDAQDKKLADILRSTERSRKYLLWTLLITIVVVVLPAFGLLFAIPQFLTTYSQLGL